MKDLKTLEGIGTIDMRRCCLCGGIDLYLEINTLADDMIETVNKAIEQAKIEYNKDNAEEMINHNYHWSDKGVIIIPEIHIYAEEGVLDGITKAGFELVVYFDDKENSALSGYAYIDIDLSNHRKEILTMLVEGCKRELEKLE